MPWNAGKCCNGRSLWSPAPQLEVDGKFHATNIFLCGVKYVHVGLPPVAVHSLTPYGCDIPGWIAKHFGAGPIRSVPTLYDCIYLVIPVSHQAEVSERGHLLVVQLGFWFCRSRRAGWWSLAGWTRRLQSSTRSTQVRDCRMVRLCDAYCLQLCSCVAHSCILRCCSPCYVVQTLGVFPMHPITPAGAIAVSIKAITEHAPMTVIHA